MNHLVPRCLCINSCKQPLAFLVEDSLFPFIVLLVGLPESCTCTPPLLCLSYRFVGVVHRYFLTPDIAPLVAGFYQLVRHGYEHKRNTVQIIFVSQVQKFYVVWFIFVFKFNSEGI